MADSPFKPNILAGQTALVTGGSSGIGLEIAMQLGLHGAKVAIMGRRQAVIDEALDALRAAGVTAHGVTGDVRRPEACAAVVEGTTAALGAPNILVNAAAGNFLSPAEELSPNAFRTVMEIDAIGTFNMCRAAFGALRGAAEKGAAPLGQRPTGAEAAGRLAEGTSLIVNISMTLHYGATWWQAHASAAKSAIDSLTRSLALEWGAHGIRVTGIAPGPIAGTAGLTKLAPGTAEQMEAYIAKGIPLGRLGTKKDIALSTVYLASSAGSYVTGHTLVVDGAEWMHKEPMVAREVVGKAARSIEKRSRAVGTARSKL